VQIGQKVVITGGLMLSQMMLTRDQLMVTKLTYLQLNFSHGILQTHTGKVDGKHYLLVLTELMP
jgi:hypothetical protein